MGEVAMDWGHILAIAVALGGAVSVFLELVVKVVTNGSLLRNLAGQYRDRLFVGISLLTCLALGMLLGEHILWTKLRSEIDGDRGWAARCEDEKKVLSEALDHAPAAQRKYDEICARPRASCIILYDTENFQGRSLALPDSASDLRMLAYNDTARSIKVLGNVSALAHVDIDFLGGSLEVNTSLPSLPVEFQRSISSIQVFREP